MISEDIRKFVREGHRNPPWLLQKILPHYFPEPLTWFQRAAVAIFLRRTQFLKDDPDLPLILNELVVTRADKTQEPIFYVQDGEILIRDKRNLLFMFPRGFGKTTLVGNALPLYSILYCIYDFMVYISQAATHSRMQLSAVKKELEDNEVIRAVWGDLVPARDDVERWSIEQIETSNNVALMAKSRGGQVRGLKLGPRRPNLLLFDDLQDTSELSTTQTLENDLQWFMGSAMNTLAADNSRAIMLGTYLGPGSIIDHVLTLATEGGSSWGVCAVGALLSDGTPTWPRILNKTNLEIKRQESEAVGAEHMFWREYMNVDVPTDKRPFHASNIILELPPPETTLQVAMFMDPALSKERTADKCAIVVWGVDPETGLRYKLYEWAKRTDDATLICETYVKASIQFGVVFHAIEANGFQKLLLGPIRIAQKALGKHFEVHSKIHHDPKRGRIIGTLQPLYKQGLVRWADNFPSRTDLLKYVAVGFRGSDDVLDADAACNVLLDELSCSLGGGKARRRVSPVHSKKLLYAVNHGMLQ